VSEHSTRLLTPAVQRSLAQLRSLIFDVDGVLTDDTIYVGPGGVELKRFHVSDGLGIVLMKKRLKLKVAALSGRHSEATTTRAVELGIVPCMQGVQDKRQGVQKILAAHRVTAEQAAFVGNEILDLGAFSAVGFKIAVADAAPEVIARADFVLRRNGGAGVARELLELICRARGVDYVGWYA
jgi:3-deoxy-D-manno-octulosonate 8-phosphate phosphatase (KDO 8-P phosphatase)